MRARSRSSPPPDRILLGTLALLVVGGLFIFLSASLGLLAGGGADFASVAKSQIFLGFGGGMIALLFFTWVPYRLWRRYSLFLFIGALALTLLVFVPGIGISLNGARRWLSIGSLTVQPAEFLKIAYILYLATWFSAAKSKVGEARYGLLPFLAITGATGVVLLIQPDTDTFAVIAASGAAMYLAAGAKPKHIAALALLAMVGLSALFIMRPYLFDRLTTFLHPENDPRGSSYQIRQSLLAVGAGEAFGRGFGQSIQKFGKLPAPISDSIFPVFAEEFGFLGSIALILLYLTFALRGLWIAARSPDLYGGLIAIGIVVMIIGQSFFNIASMVALLPLGGLPLVFVSHGGTALMAALAASGLLLSVSRYAKS